MTVNRAQTPWSSPRRRPASATAITTSMCRSAPGGNDRPRNERVAGTATDRVRDVVCGAQNSQRLFSMTIEIMIATTSATTISTMISPTRPQP